jgi:pyrroline-5-carboxylate reductase
MEPFKPSVIGFIGTGNIASALVAGFASNERPPAVLVSPRSYEKSAALAARFDNVSVAPDNQAVVDGADTIFLCVRPPAAKDVLSALRFRTDQRVVSLVATWSLADLRPLLNPVQKVVRAVPLPPAARCLGAVPYCPDHSFARPLLAEIGKPLPLETERQLDVICTVTALIAPFYALMASVGGWAAENGVEPATAAEYTAAMFHALAALALEGAPDRFARLAEEAATPGGLNEQAVARLRQAGFYAEVRDALDAILKRFQ